MKRNWLYIVLILLISAAVFACGKSETPTEEGSKEKGEKAVAATDYEVDEIRLAGGDWGYPSPFAHYPRGPGGFKMALIFDSLLERDEKGLIPWLAESWQIEDNGHTYRFTLREGVKWQDGTPLTAEDVAFSIDYANRHAAVWSYIFNAVSSIEIASTNEIRISLKSANATMLDYLGRTRIIPKHIWENVERPKEFTAPEAVIGCGPYRLTDYSKEHGTYRFEAFDNYWGPRPRVRVVMFIPVSEQVLAYEKKEIDMTAVTPDLLPRFQKDPANKILRNPAFWGYRLLMNFEKVPWLRDVRIRQALAYAINRQELVDKIARGAAVPGRMGILPPDHVMAAEDVRSYPFDPQQAKSLLDAAGMNRMNPEGFRLTADNTPFAMEILCSAQEVRMAELMRQQLKTVGIKLDIRATDAKTRDTKVRGLDYQVAILGHGGWGGDPDYLTHHLAADVFDQNASPSSSGLAGLDAPELMALLKHQSLEIDPQKRQQLITDIQKRVAELVPEIPLFYTAGYTVFRPAKYDGWMYMYDHHNVSHGKLSYLRRTGPAAPRVR